MELRRLRQFLAVGEALNFTRAAKQLRIAQPALSRHVQDLEDEARELLRRADESVENVRALARGEYGELHVGYSSVPTVEILPPALAAFRKTVPRVRMLLHLSSDDLIAGLLRCSLQLWSSRQARRPWASSLNRCALTRGARR